MIIFLIILQLLSVIFPIQRKKLKRKLRLKSDNFFKKRDYLDNFTKDTSNLKNILKSKKKKLKNFISKRKYKKLSNSDVQLLSQKNNIFEIDKHVNINKEIKNSANVDFDNNKKEYKITKANSKELIVEKNFDENQLNLKNPKLNNDPNQTNSNTEIFEKQKKYSNETEFKGLIEDKKTYKNIKNQENQTEFENQLKLNEIKNLKNITNDQPILNNELKESPAKQLKKITENENNTKLINSEEKKIVSCEDENKINSYKVQNKDLSSKKDKFPEPEEMKISFKEEKIINMVDNKNLINVSDKILSSSNEQKISKDFDSKLNYCNKLNDNEINFKSKTDNKIFPIKQLTETNNLDDDNRFVGIDNQSSYKLSENLIKNDLSIKENTEKYFLVENSNKNLLTNNNVNNLLTRDTKNINPDFKLKKNDSEENDLNTRDIDKIDLEKYNSKKINKTENNLIDTIKEFKNIKTNSKKIQDMNDSKFISINETFSNKKNLVETKNTFTKNESPKFSKIPISWKIEVNGKNQIAEDTIDLEKNEDCNVFRLKLPSAIFDLQNQSEKC